MNNRTEGEVKLQNSNNRRVYLTLLKSAVQRENERNARSCELCKEAFHPNSRHALFCDRCKHNDRYRYAEWLPTADEI